jgi:hypothetical protein
VRVAGSRTEVLRYTLTQNFVFFVVQGLVSSRRKRP